MHAHEDIARSWRDKAQLLAHLGALAEEEAAFGANARRRAAFDMAWEHLKLLRARRCQVEALVQGPGRP